MLLKLRKQLRLKTTVFAVDAMAGRGRALFVPAGEIVEVMESPHAKATPMVEIRWGDKVLMLFAADVEDCTEELPLLLHQRVT